MYTGYFDHALSILSLTSSQIDLSYSPNSPVTSCSFCVTAHCGQFVLSRI